MSNIHKALASVTDGTKSKTRRTVLSFEEFLTLAANEPERVLRSIFQLFHDMVLSGVKRGKDEYPDDPESIGFVEYDCSKIFVDNADNPFFPDRLFANRFIRQVEDMRQGSQQNRIYAYLGPPGCGKSTFLSNLLRRFQEYTDTKEGQSYETFWEIDEDLFRANTRALDQAKDDASRKTIVPCPSHDHPILLIPKQCRLRFFDKLFPKEQAAKFREAIAKDKGYEWLLKEESCTICNSLFWALYDKVGSLDAVWQMVMVRPYKFDRRLGEGISVYNPGDRQSKADILNDEGIQKKLDSIFGMDVVNYVYSRHAKTNNGIYALADIKDHNMERLCELHNVISEEVHKIGSIEEKIKSIFIVLLNPEDKKKLEEKNASSFAARMRYSNINYVLDVPTEVRIYRSIFGENIVSRFQPKVLQNFARVIISSRMKKDCPPLKEWIPYIQKYSKYCDEYGFLLRMEIYSGLIPPWLSEDDKAAFSAKVRRKLIKGAENEGFDRGFAGRDAIKHFSDFLSAYGARESLISMENVADYFMHKVDESKRKEYGVTKEFMDSLVAWYDYEVLGEVKEAMYSYSEGEIQRDILNYICAVNYEPGTRFTCKYTGDVMEDSTEFLKEVGRKLTGEALDDPRALKLAKDVQQKYVEIVAQGDENGITETEFYKRLLAAYIRNSKMKVLVPFIANDNFRNAVKAFGTDEFRSADSRIATQVRSALGKLVKRFGYTEQGAKEIILYTFDRKLYEKFQ